MADITFTGKETVQTFTYEPLPSGSYLCTVEAEPTFASTGTPMVKLALTVEDDRDGGDHKGRRLTRSIPVLGKTEESTESIKGRVQMLCIAAHERPIEGTIDDSRLNEAVANHVSGSRMVVKIIYRPTEYEKDSDGNETETVKFAASNDLEWGAFFPASTW